MDLNSLVETTKVFYGDSNLSEDEVVVYLSIAKGRILNRLFPYGYEDEEEVPSKYEHLLIELTTRLLARRGAEGEVQHSENGVARIYESPDDEDLLSQVVSMGKVL